MVDLFIDFYSKCEKLKNIYCNNPDYIKWNEFKTTWLILACEIKYKELAQQIIKDGKLNPQHIDEKGITEIIAAIDFDEDVAQQLIDSDQYKDAKFTEADCKHAILCKRYNIATKLLSGCNLD